MLPNRGKSIRTPGREVNLKESDWRREGKETKKKGGGEEKNRLRNEPKRKDKATDFFQLRISMHLVKGGVGGMGS